MTKICVPCIVAVILAACGSDSEPPSTLGQACTGMAERWCDRARECDPSLAPTQTACVNTLVRACCSDKRICGDAVREVSEDQWNDCLDDFDELACSDIKAGNAPSSCLAL